MMKSALNTQRTTILPFSQNKSTSVIVMSASALTLRAIPAAVSKIACTNRHFSSCNSTENSSTRLCAVASVRSASLFTEAKRPLFVSLILLARDEHADKQAHAESDSDALIGIIANHFVGGFRTRDGLFLQVLA